MNTAGARWMPAKLSASWKPPWLTGAVAEEGDADVVAALRARAHADADRMADAGGDDAVGAEQADRAVVEMHGAAAPAAAAVALAEQLRHQHVRDPCPWPAHGRGRDGSR